MEDLVAFSGWQPNVDSFFNNIDLFVLASRHDEGYGLVVAEAMAYGLPVVITNSGGAVEIVENGINGYIVEKRDVEMMAQKIVLLSNNLHLSHAMGQSGYKRINSKFNIKNQVTHLQTLLLTLKNKNAVR
jgi:glycosyltransferase involved in cell wall biosynthesis